MADEQPPTPEEVKRVMAIVRAAEKERKSPSISAVLPKIETFSTIGKYLWTVIVFLFMGGVAFQYYSDRVVMSDDFKPVQKAVESQLPLMADKLAKLESRTQTTGSEMTDVRVQLGAMTEMLNRIDSSQREFGRQSSISTLCAMHRDIYVTQLADYATRVRKKPPQRSDEYRKCMVALTSRLHGVQ